MYSSKFDRYPTFAYPTDRQPPYPTNNEDFPPSNPPKLGQRASSDNVLQPLTRRKTSLITRHHSERSPLSSRCVPSLLDLRHTRKLQPSTSTGGSLPGHRAAVLPPAVRPSPTPTHNQDPALNIGLDLPAGDPTAVSSSQAPIHIDGEQGAPQISSPGPSPGTSSIPIQLGAQQPLMNNHQTSSRGGPLPLDTQRRDLNDAGVPKLFSPEPDERATADVNSMPREIELDSQYKRREVPDSQQAQMNQAVVVAHPFAVEFQRTVMLRYILFNDPQLTKELMEQAGFWSSLINIDLTGEQRYIMTPEDVNVIHNSLQMAIDQLQVAHSQNLKLEQERTTKMRAAEAYARQIAQQPPGAPTEDVSTASRSFWQSGWSNAVPDRLPTYPSMSIPLYELNNGGPGPRNHDHKPSNNELHLTYSQGGTPDPQSRPQPPLASLRASQVSLVSPGNHTQKSFPEVFRWKKAQRHLEPPPLTGLLPYSGSQVELQPVSSYVLAQQTTHAMHSPLAISPSKCNTGVTTPPRNSASPTSKSKTGGGSTGLPNHPRSLTRRRFTPELEFKHENRGMESKVKTSTTRGTKRRLETVHEQDTEEQGTTGKRGKITHHDYANMSSNRMDSPLHKEDTAECTMQGTEMQGSSQAGEDTQSGQISREEIFQRLVDHGCVNLSSHMDPEQYSPGLIIGGAFGDIWKGKLRDGTAVAIKVWRFSSLLHNGSKAMKRAMREIYYWSKVKHEYVQELMGVIMFQGRLGMVSRWMEQGNLREYICKNPSVDRYALCMQVASGVAYLHSREMVHGDLKGINILVSHNGIAKLSDFDHSIMSGCSLVFSDTSKLGGGTTRWMAPELILEDKCSRNGCTDVYSLGMTMLEIITGNPPYYPQCQEDVQVIRAIMKETLLTRPMDHLGDDIRGNQMWGLLLRCWNYDPVARPKSAEVVKSLQDILTLPNSPV